MANIWHPKIDEFSIQKSDDTIIETERFNADKLRRKLVNDGTNVMRRMINELASPDKKDLATECTLSYFVLEFPYHKALQQIIAVKFRELAKIIGIPNPSEESIEGENVRVIVAREGDRYIVEESHFTDGISVASDTVPSL